MNVQILSIHPRIHNSTLERPLEPSEDKPVTTCYSCGCDLYEGDRAFDLECDGDLWCEECIREWIEGKEVEVERS